MNARVKSLVSLGYTDNQAAFLELGALGSGYFLRKQFNEYIERRCGALGQAFVERALEKQHIRLIEVLGGRRLYHTFGHSLFRALGDENNRNRRSHQAQTIRRRLMALDYCVSNRACQWLLTEREKVSFFRSQGVPDSDLPSETFGGAKRFFIDKQPLSVDDKGNPTLVFVDEGLKALSQWELFLRSHRALIQRLQQTAVVYAGFQPERFVAAERMFGRIITGETAVGAFDIGRLKRFFDARKLFEARDYANFDQLRLDQFREDRKVFTGERVDALYGSWLVAGDTVLAPVRASRVSFRTYQLKQAYEWLSPVYGEERRGGDALNSIASKAGS